ncbi:MAG: S8 family serine peptidase [Thauera sp.]
MKSPASLRKPVLASLVVALGAALLPAQAFAADEAQWVPGRLLVQPRAGLPEAEFDKIVKQHGGKQVGKIEGINVRVIQLPPQASEKAVEALLKRNKHLKFAERDMLVKPSTTNDPYYANGWHLPKIGTPTAWQTSSGSNVVIAILDSGVDADHPDLAANLVPGWNMYDNNADTTDVNGHGTKVAGAAAALTNNAVGVAAVAGNARVMPMRVSGADGYAYYSTIASALTWAADRGARVANISFYGVETSSSARSAAQYLKNKGGLVVTSAGNYGVEETIAPSDTMITVSATDSNDNKTSWSSYGSFVDVAAPGSSIYSTVNGGGYGAVSGTSFSSPITAGVVALMMAANPALSPAELEKALYSSALDLGTAGFDKYFGNGRVDAAAAVAASVASVKIDSTAPSTSITSPSGGTNVSGLVAVDVAASDDTGVSRVDLLVNGVKVGSDTSAPYGFSWDSTTAADGDASIVAYAYDAAGNAASHSVKVSVANTVVEEPVVEEPVVNDPVVEKVADVVAPVAKLGNPTDGSVISGNIAITGSATDDVGVSGLRLLIDGKQVASVSGSSISYRLNTKKLSAGSHTITLEAYDAAGNVGSHNIRVTR